VFSIRGAIQISKYRSRKASEWACVEVAQRSDEVLPLPAVKKRLGGPEGDDNIASRHSLRLARYEEVNKSKEEMQTFGATPPPQTGRGSRDREDGLGEGAAAAQHPDEDAVAEVMAVPGPP
jgi:hypothetical protein